MSRAEAAALLLGAGVALGVSSCDFGKHTTPVQLGVELVLEHCPLIATWKASPLQASAPGGKIDVSVTALPSFDRDGGPDGGADAGPPLEYMWSAASGTFDDTTAPTTVYRCGAAGSQVLTITVTDKALRVPCADVVALAVKCLAKAP
jgi:hypothetical protein